MLIEARSLRQIRFGELTEVYLQSLREGAGSEQALLRQEQEFYRYLRDVFFKTPSAVYAIWEEKGKYVCAFRMEPYRDGLLLAGLETKPEDRRKGYGRKLIRKTQERLCAGPAVKLYAHVHKANAASMGLHQSCGFQIIANNARYLDGSVDSKSVTLLWEHK